jgi:cytidylate kinase
LLDGEDVSDRIRTPEIARQASLISALPEVRKTLVLLQRAMGKEQSIIMDGRDIGTNVFPKANHKFYLTASVEERAKRRYAELLEQGEEANLTDVAAAIAERDYNDSTRAINPLRKAADAVEVDTTSMSPEEVAAELLSIIRGKVNEGTDH